MRIVDLMNQLACMPDRQGYCRILFPLVHTQYGMGTTSRLKGFIWELANAAE